MNEKKNRIKWGFTWALIGAFLWGIGYIPLSALWHVYPLNDPTVFPSEHGHFIATLLASAGLSIGDPFIFALLFVVGQGKMSEVYRTFFNPKISKWLLLAGFCGGVFALYGSTLAVGYIGGSFSASAALLCGPIAALTARLWYKEKINKRTITAIVFTIIGGAFIWNPLKLIEEISNSGSSWLGYVGGLMAAFGWGMEATVAGRTSDLCDTEACVTVRLIWDALIWICIMIPAASLIFGFDTISTVFIAAYTNPQFIFWEALASASFAAAYIGMYKSYVLIGAGRGQSISTFYVIFAIMSLSLFLGESFKWWLLVGSLITIGGTFVMYWESKDTILETTREVESS
ncbi:DMT family transporter [Methanosarcina sp. KYL-1]|uniref:DMT family transporter n=1 Tax=Methanosarcina sp. KYL-1 TaxID=2602068 RepID=UPI00210148BE|nr:DMT family transporter [Methanosarcina sp. KYL-1]MCQ1534407.1 DMT family transporter [Methanosarcina sp. KYL-1]